MSAIAIPARPAGHYEFVPSSFQGKSGALFLRLAFRPDSKDKPAKEKTGGTGTR
jgi:hypothetical protein